MKRLYRFGVVLAIVGSLLCLPVVVMDTIAGATGTITCNLTTSSSSTAVEALGDFGTDTGFIGGTCFNVPSGSVHIQVDVQIGSVWYAVHGDFTGSGGTVAWSTGSLRQQFVMDSLSEASFGDGTPAHAGVYAYISPSFLQESVGTVTFSDHSFDSTTGGTPVTTTTTTAPPLRVLGGKVNMFASSFSAHVGSVALPLTVALVGFLVLLWVIRFVYGFLRRRRL